MKWLAAPSTGGDGAARGCGPRRRLADNDFRDRSGDTGEVRHRRRHAGREDHHHDRLLFPASMPPTRTPASTANPRLPVPSGKVVRATSVGSRTTVPISGRPLCGPVSAPGRAARDQPSGRRRRPQRGRMLRRPTSLRAANRYPTTSGKPTSCTAGAWSSPQAAATTSAIGLPPAAAMPRNRNSESPVSTAQPRTTGSQIGSRRRPRSPRRRPPVERHLVVEYT